MFKLFIIKKLLLIEKGNDKLSFFCYNNHKYSDNSSGWCINGTKNDS